MWDLWYKDAIIYSLDVETFADSNGDGIGDFQGLTGRLDYLSGLGVTCIWLLPFHPSPNRDDGYDVTDYYAVDSRLGTLGDFVDFMDRARERGLRVIIDLVVNHTSIEHPWFQQARQDPKSRYRKYYVWSRERPSDAEIGMVFPGPQKAIWTFDEQAGEWYLHRFYEHQPDLNITNPAVREEIRKIMGFWLALGVSGFRLDAAPYLIELKGIEGADTDDPYVYLRELRDFLSWRRGDAIMLAEANVERDTVPQYFGDGTRMHMLFNFLLNQDLFLALAQERAEPLARGLSTGPELVPASQWAVFLRNHDELDLGRLSEQDREAVYAVFAPDLDMRVYGRGIRRRLAPILGGDPRRIRLAYSLMLSLPGTPVLRYGEEIGMGDDLSQGERKSVRTPMQWTSGPNGGFSEAPAECLVIPVIRDGDYSYERVNVADQRRDKESLLNWIERMLRTRCECREIGWGSCTVLDTGDAHVFGHCCEWRGSAVVALHNLSGEPRTAVLDLRRHGYGRMADLLGDSEPQPIEDVRRVELEPYGYRWYRMDEKRSPMPA